MKQKTAQKIADETKATYDKVASEFSSSRHVFWEELAFLSEHTVRDDHVLDVGCGNGRFYPLIKERHANYTGLDYSEGLIDEAKKRYPDGHFIVGNAVSLPFPANTFDVLYSFAVIHHLPGKELRRNFIREGARVLHPGGTFVITAWELWTRKHFPQLLFSALKSVLMLSPLHIGDVMMTFGKTKSARFLHAFTRGELSQLLEENGFDVIGIDTIPRQSGEENIVVVAKKRI